MNDDPFDWIEDYTSSPKVIVWALIGIIVGGIILWVVL